MIIKIPNTEIKHLNDIDAIIEHVKRNWNYTKITTKKDEEYTEILVHHSKPKRPKEVIYDE